VTPTLANTPKPNLNRRQVEALSLLARLLATENIRVQHSHRAATASFDTKSRLLTLPVWKAMDGDLYDMLVAHEVGHAMHSPKGDAWVKELTEIVGKEGFNSFKGYVNIVEDARIERSMKDTYPGLRSTFAKAYRSLTITNPKLLALDKDLSELPLIDRINIHYKVGFAVNVPFSAAELPLVKRVATTKSWDEVVALAKELFDYSSQEESQGEDGDMSQPQDGEEGEGSGSPQDNQKQESDEEQGDSSGSDESEEGEEQGDTADEGENENADDSTEGGEEGDESDNASDEGDESDSDSDDESEGEAQGKSTKESKNRAPRESVTDSAFDELAKQNRDEHSNYGTSTVRMPTFDAAKGILPFSEVIDDLRLMAEKGDGFALYQQFMAKNRRSITALVQEFMRRKAADEANRTRTADTGAIDPSRLWAYRISEEIFGSYEVKKEGKNHGLVFLLDWSGSMNRILEPTIMQLGCLVQFCAAANIPCEVYAFSDAHGIVLDKVWTRNDGELIFSDFRLLNILSASAKPVQIRTALAGLLAWAKHSRSYRHDEKFGKNAKGDHLASKYYLNGTPLNAAIASMATLVPMFRAKTGVQIVNTVILTDGEATDRTGYRYVADRWVNVWTDDNSPTGYSRDFAEVNIQGKRAVEAYTGAEDAYLRYLRVEADCNVIGFRIDGTRALNSYMQTCVGRMSKKTKEYAKYAVNAESYIAAKKKFLRDEGWVSGEEWMGYSEWFGLTDLEADEEDYLDAIDGTTATKAKLARALSDEISKNKTSRPLMARIAARVSKRD
jgi:hypothetical protein